MNMIKWTVLVIAVLIIRMNIKEIIRLRKGGKPEMMGNGKPMTVGSLIGASATCVMIVLAVFLWSYLLSDLSGGGYTNTSKCTICGKKATHTYQGSGYCDTHYLDAVKWSIDHTK